MSSPQRFHNFRAGLANPTRRPTGATIPRKGARESLSGSATDATPRNQGAFLNDAGKGRSGGDENAFHDQQTLLSARNQDAFLNHAPKDRRSGHENAFPVQQALPSAWFQEAFLNHAPKDRRGGHEKAPAALRWSPTPRNQGAFLNMLRRAAGAGKGRIPGSPQAQACGIRRLPNSSSSAGPAGRTDDARPSRRRDPWKRHVPWGHFSSRTSERLMPASSPRPAPGWRSGGGCGSLSIYGEGGG